MTDDVVVADSSPIIALDQIGLLENLPLVFRAIHVPPSVAAEISPSVSLPAWLHVTAPDPLTPVPVFPARLGPGERDAFLLAVALQADIILLDDLPARNFAVSQGRRVLGTLGLLLAFKKSGIIDTVEHYIDDLIAHRFRVDAPIRNEILKIAGEFQTVD